MEGSDKQEQGNKKVTDVKTYSVPFALEASKENIIISTSTPSKPAQPSKEQIINQAYKFQLEGNILEAAKYYQYFINQGFKDHRVFTNYGVILKNLGKLKEAEISYRKAIELKPDFAEAHCNLGNILRENGDLSQSMKCSERIMSIRPWSIIGSYSFNNRMKSNSSHN